MARFTLLSHPAVCFLKILTLRLPLQNPQNRRILERECLLVDDGNRKPWVILASPSSKIAGIAIFGEGDGRG